MKKLSDFRKYLTKRKAGIIWESQDNSCFFVFCMITSVNDGKRVSGLYFYQRKKGNDAFGQQR